jgi:hypothetical protein
LACRDTFASFWYVVLGSSAIVDHHLCLIEYKLNTNFAFIGSVDMLLHLLVNITNLPVTKAAIKDSGMGVTIGTIGKHEICKDTPNEHAIKEKINILKDSWNSSVKARKAIEAGKEPVKPLAAPSPLSDTSKREAPVAASSNSPIKRHKTDVPVDAKGKLEQQKDAAPKKATVFNALIKTVKSGSPNGVGASSKLYSKPKESFVALNPSKPVSTTIDNTNAFVSKQENVKQGRFYYFYCCQARFIFHLNFAGA